MNYTALKNKFQNISFRLQFSFGMFCILLVPLLLFQSVILFLFSLSVDSGILDQAPFLIRLVELLEFTTLLLLLLTLFFCALGMIFDRQRVFATSGGMLSIMALLILFCATQVEKISGWMPF